MLASNDRNAHESTSCQRRLPTLRTGGALVIRLDVADWLRELGLEQYASAFRDNAIEPDVLPSLNADDLKDIGVTPVGHRRRLLDAIAILKSQISSTADATAAEPGPARASPTAPRSTDAERRQLTVMFCDLVG